MTTTRIPLVAQINVTIFSQAVTAAYGSAGDLVNYSAACSSVLLRNPGEVWPIEFKVGSGAWTRLEIYNTTLLGISLDTTTIRVRKASANSGSGLVQLDIKGLASTYLAGDDAVDLGANGGAAAFTDLTDAPEELDARAHLRVSADGLRVECAPTRAFVRQAVRWVDNTGASLFTSGTYDYGVDGVNLGSVPSVGDDILNANPQDEGETGVWRISAINLGSHTCTVAKRADFADGELVSAGEIVFDFNAAASWICYELDPLGGYAVMAAETYAYWRIFPTP